MSLNGTENEVLFDPAWVAKTQVVQDALLAKKYAEKEALKDVPLTRYFSETAVDSIQTTMILPEEFTPKITLN